MFYSFYRFGFKIDVQSGGRRRKWDPRDTHTVRMVPSRGQGIYPTGLWSRHLKHTPNFSWERMKLKCTPETWAMEGLLYIHNTKGVLYPRGLMDKIYLHPHRHCCITWPHQGMQCIRIQKLCWITHRYHFNNYWLKWQPKLILLPVGYQKDNCNTMTLKQWTVRR